MKRDRSRVRRVPGVLGSTFALVCIAVLALVLANCSDRDHNQEIVVSEALVRPAKPGAVTAGYFRLRNHRTDPDVLLSASCDCAARTEMHRMLHEGMEMKMVPMENVALPAGAEVRFEPGGMHLMISGVSKELRNGEKVQLTLLFRSAPERRVEARVGHPE